MVNYLQDVSNFKHRKVISKLRASDHEHDELNIEVGSQDNNKLPLNDRVCKL